MTDQPEQVEVGDTMSRVVLYRTDRPVVVIRRSRVVAVSEHEVVLRVEGVQEGAEDHD